jgi:hypothetical protein
MTELDAAAIETDHLSRSFGDVLAVRQVDLKVSRRWDGVSGGMGSVLNSQIQATVNLPPRKQAAAIPFVARDAARP